MISLEQQIHNISPNIDWSTHPLGPIKDWQQSLKTSAAIVLNSAFPMFMTWGQERYFFYNNSYTEILADKHPAFGKKFEDVWSDIWNDILPLVHSVDQGKAIFLEDLLIVMNRRGYREDTYFTFSYSPILDDDGLVQGLHCACTETTKRVQLEKELQSEKEKVEANLTRDKNHLISLLENIPGAVAYLEGRNFYFSYVNGLYRKLFLSGHDFTGSTVADVLPEAEAQGFIKLLEDVFDTGIRYEGNKQLFEANQPDGSVKQIYLNFVYEAVRDAQNEIIGILAVIYDVTSAVEVEQKLIESEQRLQSIITQALVGICETDFSGRFILANDYFCMLVGRSREELLTLTIQDICHPDDLLEEAIKFKKMIETDEGFEIEKRFVKPDGSIVWVHNTVSPINHAFAVTVSTDITEKKLAQIEFEKNVDVSPSILWITDKDGKCTYLSKQWFEFTGQTIEEGLGYGWLDATHPDDKEPSGKNFIESNAKQVPFLAEYRLRTKSGDYRWAIDAGNPRFDKNGVYQGYAGAVFDVHDRKLAELKVEAERQKLESAVRARDEFLSIASHELKTPLTSLQLQSQLHKRSIAKKRPEVFLPETMIEFVNQTEKQTLRLGRLVDDMLDVSRIRTGNLSLKIESFDLTEMLSDVVLRMKDQFLNMGYNLPVVSGPKNVVGLWDRMRIEQVAMNLLTNAIRYGQKGLVSIEVLDSPETAVIKVSDQGLGISPENQEKIFNRFERAVSANEVSGLGLGLFITKQILKSHRGSISVESELEKGSTFIVELPKK